MKHANENLDVISFGCRLNAYEAEVMRKHALDAGLKDAIFFNTCAVTQESIRQAKQAIRRARRKKPSSKIIVSGCAAQIDPATFAAMPEVDHVLGNQEKVITATYEALASDELERVKVNDIMSVNETAGHLIDGLKDRVRAFVQIQNGCDHRCTFCIIPYGRGPSRSVPAGEVVAQVQHLVEHGCPEVVLTGVDLTAYGRDLPGRLRLGGLIAKILDRVPDLRRLRLSSLDAIEIDDQLFERIGGDRRVMPHLHLSLQSGNDLTLKRMKRRHSRSDAITLCSRLRSIRPEIVFGADLIAGFPTETDTMFEDTLRLIDDCGLTWLHVFPFSARPGTPAAKMPQVSGETIRRRAAQLRAAGSEALSRHFRQLVGRDVDVLMENSRFGRLADYSPVRLSEDADLRPGATAKVRVTGQDNNVLVGRLTA